MQAGCAYYTSILISLVPDGGNTYFGRIIRQDGQVFDFDLDLDTPRMSSWRDVTNEFRQICGRNRTTKPWSEEVVASELFRELQAKSKRT